MEGWAAAPVPWLFFPSFGRNGPAGAYFWSLKADAGRARNLNTGISGDPDALRPESDEAFRAQR